MRTRRRFRPGNLACHPPKGARGKGKGGHSHATATPQSCTATCSKAHHPHCSWREMAHARQLKAPYARTTVTPAPTPLQHTRQPPRPHTPTPKSPPAPKTGERGPRSPESKGKPDVATPTQSMKQITTWKETVANKGRPSRSWGSSLTLCWSTTSTMTAILPSSGPRLTRTTRPTSTKRL